MMMELKIYKTETFAPTKDNQSFARCPYCQGEIVIESEEIATLRRQLAEAQATIADLRKRCEDHEHDRAGMVEAIAALRSELAKTVNEKANTFLRCSLLEGVITTLKDTMREAKDNIDGGCFLSAIENIDNTLDVLDSDKCPAPPKEEE